MNFHLNNIPDRTMKPRTNGITMVMDKGTGLEGVKDFLSVAAPYVDIVKLGFGTAFVTDHLREKIDLYRSHNIPVYFGGTLFEAFLIRNQFDDYVSVIKEFGLEYVEVSDGSITIPHVEKCGYIEKLAQQVKQCAFHGGGGVGPGGVFGRGTKGRGGEGRAKGI